MNQFEELMAVKSAVELDFLSLQDVTLCMDGWYKKIEEEDAPSLLQEVIGKGLLTEEQGVFLLQGVEDDKQSNSLGAEIDVQDRYLVESLFGITRKDDGTKELPKLKADIESVIVCTRCGAKFKMKKRIVSTTKFKCGSCKKYFIFTEKMWRKHNRVTTSKTRESDSTGMTQEQIDEMLSKKGNTVNLSGTQIGEALKRLEASGKKLETSKIEAKPEATDTEQTSETTDTAVQINEATTDETVSAATSGMTISGDDATDDGLSSGMTISGDDSTSSGMTISGDDDLSSGMTISGDDGLSSGMTISGDDSASSGMTISGDDSAPAGMTISGDEVASQPDASIAPSVPDTPTAPSAPDVPEPAPEDEDVPDISSMFSDEEEIMFVGTKFAAPTPAPAPELTNQQINETLGTNETSSPTTSNNDLAISGDNLSSPTSDISGVTIPGSDNQASQTTVPDSSKSSDFNVDFLQMPGSENDAQDPSDLFNFGFSNQAEDSGMGTMELDISSTHLFKGGEEEKKSTESTSDSCLEEANKLTLLESIFVVRHSLNFDFIEPKEAQGLFNTYYKDYHGKGEKVNPASLLLIEGYITKFQYETLAGNLEKDRKAGRLDKLKNVDLNNPQAAQKVLSLKEERKVANIVCPKCKTKYRMRITKKGGKFKCGKCQSYFFLKGKG